MVPELRARLETGRENEIVVKFAAPRRGIITQNT
jgi:hypothetical protein